MNTPNKLTLIRIFIVPVIIVLSLIDFNTTILDIPLNYILIDVLFVIACITDDLDGYLARKNNQVTNFGKFLDPIADKILVITCLIILVGYGKIPTVIPIIVIFREFLVSGYRLIAVESKGKVIPANIWGKIKTVTQMIAIIMSFLEVNIFGEFTTGRLSGFALVFNFLSTTVMTISVIATIISGYKYLKEGKDLLKQ